MMQSFRRLMLSLLICLWGVSTLSACMLGMDDSIENSTSPTTQVTRDTDSKMEGALGLIFNMPQVDDRLNASGGDVEDWRYIIIPEAGKLSITMNLDTPSSMQGGWSIFDSQGRTLSSQSFNGSQGFYEFRDYPVQKGIYYFRTFAESGSSVYTLGAQFIPNPPEVKPVVAKRPDPEPEEVVEEEVKPKKSSSKKSSSKSSSSKPKAEPKVVEPEPTGRKIKGFISVITVNEQTGEADITIRGVGTKSGVQTGDTGVVDGGTKIKMDKCYPTSCVSNLSAAKVQSLRQNASVTFTVQE